MHTLIFVQRLSFQEPQLIIINLIRDDSARIYPTCSGTTLSEFNEFVIALSEGPNESLVCPVYGMTISPKWLAASLPPRCCGGPG